MRNRSAQPRLSHAKGWFSALLIVLLLFYLLFVWYLERISLSNWVAQFTPVALQLRGPSLIFALIFRVLRHLIPVLVGWWFAYQASIETIERLYDLNDTEAARRFLGRLRAPTSRMTAVSINQATLEKNREESVILRIGGPGKIALGASEVAVTEINGRRARVLGSGRQILSPYEYVHAVLDLREQERTVESVPLRTKDNIEVTAAFTLVFRVLRGETVPSKSKPYPYDEEAVKLAAYEQTVLANGMLSDWLYRPILSTKSKLTETVAKYQLDELMHPSGHSDEPYLTLQRQVLRAARADLVRNGIDLVSVHIQQLKPQKEVEAQYIAYWQSQWQSKVKLSEADGNATAVEEIEIARAEAEVAMIQAILEGIQRARRSGATSRTSEIVALRLVEGLERIAERSRQSEPILPLMNQLQADLKTSSLLQSQHNHDHEGEGA